jgi:hypothetical protein
MIPVNLPFVAFRAEMTRGSAVFNMRLGIPPTGSAPVEARAERKRQMGFVAPGLVFKPGSHRCGTGGEREKRKERGSADGKWGAGASFQTWLPPVRDWWGAREEKAERGAEGRRGAG